MVLDKYDQRARRGREGEICIAGDRYGDWLSRTAGADHGEVSYC